MGDVGVTGPGAEVRDRQGGIAMDRVALPLLLLAVRVVTGAATVRSSAAAASADTAGARAVAGGAVRPAPADTTGQRAAVAQGGEGPTPADTGAALGRRDAVAHGRAPRDELRPRERAARRPARRARPGRGRKRRGHARRYVPARAALRRADEHSVRLVRLARGQPAAGPSQARP